MESHYCRVLRGLQQQLRQASDTLPPEGGNEVLWEIITVLEGVLQLLMQEDTERMVHTMATDTFQGLL